jgi:hypothetical protein
MKTREELNSGLANMAVTNDTLILSLTELIAEMTNAFNRFLAKLAAGNDFQAEVDKIGAVAQKLADANAAVQSAIAQAKVEGV